MFKVVLWDYTGESAQWAKNFLGDDVEIVRTLRPEDTEQSEFIMSGDWNFVLIFEKDRRDFFNETLAGMKDKNFSTRNIIFAKDFDSWLNNPAAIYSLLKPKACGNFYRNLNFFHHRNFHRYISASAGDLHYLATSADNFVIRHIYVTGKNHTEDEMKVFYALTKKYCNVDTTGGGIFLELGANIGTAGIYFCKKVVPNLTWLAFEPDAENFKLLRINKILNDLDDRAVLVRCGVSDKFDTLTMYRNLSNPGGNGMFNNLLPNENFPEETIKVIPLDAYFEENELPASAVKYIWMDTEGYEANALLGAKKLLKENPAPIFSEFNPAMWNRTGNLENAVSLLKEAGYTRVIWVFELMQKRKENIYPIDWILNWKNSDAWIGSLGDIFIF